MKKKSCFMGMLVVLAFGLVVGLTLASCGGDSDSGDSDDGSGGGGDSGGGSSGVSLTGTWSTGYYTFVFSESTVQFYGDSYKDPSKDQLDGTGTYTVSGTALRILMNGSSKYTGTLNDASNPTSFRLAEMPYTFAKQ
jgi:hypothetical protein